MPIRVKSLHCYPVKSLRGIDLPAAELRDTGIRHDRHWLILDHRGQFLSQRHIPAMALVATALDPGALMLEATGVAPLRVPFREDNGPVQVTEVWGDECEVVDEGDAAAQWLGTVLGVDQAPRLVRMRPNYLRPQKRPERYGKDTTTLFADTAPYLVANEASLERLNESLEAKGEARVPMNRFRPNIVLEGLPPFEEDRLATLQRGDLRFSLRYPRERCVVTTINQDTAVKHAGGEPFRTLQSLNPMRDVAEAPGNPRGPAFAQLAVLESGAGKVLELGDELMSTKKKKAG